MYGVCHLGGHKKKPRFMHAPHNSHANLGRPLFNGVYSAAVLDLKHTLAWSVFYFSMGYIQWKLEDKMFRKYGSFPKYWDPNIDPNIL